MTLEKRKNVNMSVKASLMSTIIVFAIAMPYALCLVLAYASAHGNIDLEYFAL